MFPIQQSKYNRAKKQREYDVRTSTEWDLSIMIRDDSHLQQIISDSTESALTDDNVTYMLIGGLERANRGDKHCKVTTGEHQYHDHVHAALITKEPVGRAQALETFGWTLKHGAYCTPRNSSWPYLTWKYHHTKATSKVTDQFQLFEHGQLPEDDITDKVTVDKLIKFGKQFASATEWTALLARLNVQRTIVQEERNAERKAMKQLKLVEVRNERKRQRQEAKPKVQAKLRRIGPDPIKIQARMDKYKLELLQATEQNITADMARLSRNITLLAEQLT